MGMVVRSNIMAMNANRSLGMNNTQVSKNLEKLSSGFKINRAGDDASGLAISEKMKAQIKGLETASANAQDGISLVQTAEGALTEVHSMLNRMVELATKSANGTIQDPVDREAIQSEVDALLEEIDRISQSTNFNGINLLDGSLSSKGGSKAVNSMKFDNLVTTDVAAVKGQYQITNAFSADLSAAANGDKFSLTVNYELGGQTKTSTITLTKGTDADGNVVLKGDSGEEYATANGGDPADIVGAALTELKKDKTLSDHFTITDTAGDGTFQLNAKVAGSAGAKLTGVTESTTIAGATVDLANTATEVLAASDAHKTAALAGITGYDPTVANSANTSVFTVNGKKFAIANTGTDISGLGSDVNVLFTTDATDPTAFGGDLAALISKETGLNVTSDGTDLAFKTGTGNNATGGLTLQIGDTGDDFNKVTVSIDDMSSKGLGLTGLDVSNAESARAAIDTIKNAINTVSTNRANLGALQNRLEYTINNLDVAAENMSAANSRIRDTDMAKQMMEYTKTNVLTQAAQAMLAQANQQPQSILQLLQ